MKHLKSATSIHLLNGSLFQLTSTERRGVQVQGGQVCPQRRREKMNNPQRGSNHPAGSNQALDYHAIIC